MKWKDLSLKERKQIYDSVRVNNPGATYFDIKEQFDSIPAYEDGGKSIVDEVNKSNANFVQRLKSPTRQTIPNWEDQYRVLPWEKSVSTHKLSVWDNANGGGTIVPDVQEVNGKLNEIRQSLMDVNPNTYRYLTTPSENKAHMIQLKRGMQKEGLINNWTDPITQDKIEEYLSYRSKYANRVNPVLRTLYDIRPDKQGFVNRMNNLTPIEWAVPLGLPIFFGEEQENK